MNPRAIPERIEIYPGMPLDVTDEVLMAKLGEQVMLDARKACQPQVSALLAAGWKYELPEGFDDAEPFQWAWRRQPRRKGGKGRRFASTNQAYNALMRERA